jgi:acetyl/propionyl-CoA carboxylase alpha subunit
MALAQQPVEVVQVVARSDGRRISLPGEFVPYQAVDVQAKVTGFVQKVLVDRGSVVKEGDLLATLVAPELTCFFAERQRPRIRFPFSFTTNLRKSTPATIRAH